MLVTVEAERAVLVKDALNTKHECDDNANEISTALRPLKTHPFRNDLTDRERHWERHLDDFWKAYQEHGRGCDMIVLSALNARGSGDLSRLKKKLIFLQSDLRQLRIDSRNALQNARNAGVITAI